MTALSGDRGPDPVVTRLPGGCLLLGPAGVLWVEAALQCAIKRQRDGAGLVSEGVLRLLAAAGLAAEEVRAISDRNGSDHFRKGSPHSSSRPVVDEGTAGFVGTRLAAQRLRVTDRQVRYLAAQGVLPSRRLGRRWLLDEAAVAARAQQGTD